MVGVLSFLIAVIFIAVFFDRLLLRLAASECLPLVNPSQKRVNILVHSTWLTDTDTTLLSDK
jgi:hypothetical protein